MSREAMKLALEALSKSDDFLFDWHENESDNEADAYATARHLNEKAITALREALANEARDRMAENARALKLADQLEDDLHADDGTTLGLYSQGIADNAAAELRRLHKSNQQLVKVLQPFVLANSSDEHINLMVRTDDITKARFALQEALAEQPAQRTWVGLTDEERIMCRSYDPEEAVAKTEAKLREKNA